MLVGHILVNSSRPFSSQLDEKVDPSNPVAVGRVSNTGAFYMADSQ